MCNNKVDQSVPDGFLYKTISMKCGSTSIYGTELRCDECSNQRPWYMCPHGVDLSEREMACNACNAENE